MAAKEYLFIKKLVQVYTCIYADECLSEENTKTEELALEKAG